MVTFKDNNVELAGKRLYEKDIAVDFELCGSDLKRVSLNAYEGQIKILNIFPSLDTGVCEKSVIEFQNRLENFDNLILIHISKDLPFAQSRFCLAKELKSATTLSAFDSSFGKDYGLLIATGPLKGLLARCVLILDEHNQIIYEELVQEITQEPNYGAVIENLENYLKPKG
ncbi:MAG: Thiol peroxidase [Chlamydiae bacterium]|nr:Thiol peroxidase [Chlamydiota bacterium]